MSELALILSRHIGPLRRKLLRVARASGSLPELSDAQSEVLHALSANGSMTPGALADDLGMARSTISNLVKGMVAAGLVTRTLNETDGRSTALDVSDHALTLLARYDATGTELMRRALDRLPPEDREHLASAMPALGRLREALENL